MGVDKNLAISVATPGFIPATVATQVQDTETKASSKVSPEYLTKFIKEVGFPILVAVAAGGYIWHDKNADELRYETQNKVNAANQEILLKALDKSSESNLVLSNKLDKLSEAVDRLANRRR